MAAPLYRRPGEPLGAKLQAALYYARKRRRERARTSADDLNKNGEPALVGVVLAVVLTVEEP